jgi:hypothetical protein
VTRGGFAAEEMVSKHVRCGATRALERRRDRIDDGWPHFSFECNSVHCRDNAMVLLLARQAVEQKTCVFVEQLRQHNMRVRRKDGS